MTIKRDLWRTSSDLVIAPVFEDMRHDGNPNTVIFLLNHEGEAMFSLDREQALDVVEGLMWAVAQLDGEMREYRTEQLRKLQKGEQR
jgi:hypothetical protein